MSVKPPIHLKRCRNKTWHSYKDLRQRNEINSEIAGQTFIFCASINDQYEKKLYPSPNLGRVVLN